MEQKVYKRQDRSVSPETKEKISKSLKQFNAAHPRPEIWKIKQKMGLTNYWKQIPKSRHEGNGDGYIESGEVV